MYNNNSGVIVIASIILCDVACWLVVTGETAAWLVAPLAMIIFVAAVKFRSDDFGDVNDQMGDGCTTIFLLGASIPVAMLLPVVHVGHYSRFGGWLTLVVDGSVAVFLARSFGLFQAVHNAIETRMRRLGQASGLVPTPMSIETTRDALVVALLCHSEDDLAALIPRISGEQFRTIGERAWWYLENTPSGRKDGRKILVDTALALAAVEVLEGGQRELRRKRHRRDRISAGGRALLPN